MLCMPKHLGWDSTIKDGDADTKSNANAQYTYLKHQHIRYTTTIKIFTQGLHRHAHTLFLSLLIPSLNKWVANWLQKYNYPQNKICSGSPVEAHRHGRSMHKHTAPSPGITIHGLAGQSKVTIRQPDTTEAWELFFFPKTLCNLLLFLHW